MLMHAKSQLLTYTTKNKLHTRKILIIPILMYGSETWVSTENVINQIDIFEIKILKKVHASIQDREECQPLYNQELYHLHKAPDIFTDIKVFRLRLVGHVLRIKRN